MGVRVVGMEGVGSSGGFRVSSFRFYFRDFVGALGRGRRVEIVCLFRE